MTAEFIMPDGTHIRVNDEDADKMPADWTKLGAVTDSTEFVGHASIQEPEEVKAKPRVAPKSKPRTPPEA